MHNIISCFYSETPPSKFEQAGCAVCVQQLSPCRIWIMSFILVTWQVGTAKENAAAKLRANVARDLTARVRSKQLRSAVFGLWVVYVY